MTLSPVSKFDVYIFFLDEMEPNATENVMDIGEIVSNRTSQYLGVIYRYSPMITAVKVCIGVTGASKRNCSDR